MVMLVEQNSWESLIWEPPGGAFFRPVLMRVIRLPKGKAWVVQSIFGGESSRLSAAEKCYQRPPLSHGGSLPNSLNGFFHSSLKTTVLWELERGAFPCTCRCTAESHQEVLAFLWWVTSVQGLFGLSNVEISTVLTALDCKNRIIKFVLCCFVLGIGQSLCEGVPGSEIDSSIMFGWDPQFFRKSTHIMDSSFPFVARVFAAGCWLCLSYPWWIWGRPSQGRGKKIFRELLMCRCSLPFPSVVEGAFLSWLWRALMTPSLYSSTW